MLRLSFHNFCRREKINPTIFEKLLPHARTVLVGEKRILKNVEYILDLSLVARAKIQVLNCIYHKKDRPTDVISLSYYKKNMTDPFVGEIFICLSYAKQQAKKIPQSLTEELQFLFIHGLLHCFVYDHKKPHEEEEMKKLTYKILRRTK